MDNFHHFPRLPFEIRARIWDLTIEPRIVNVSVSDSYLSRGAPLPVTSTPVPAPLQTCQESRRELQRHYHRGFTEIDDPPHVLEPQQYVWVNFEMDIIDIGNGHHLRVYKAVAPQIQRLRFEAEYSDEGFARGSIKDLKFFTNIKEIFVVCMDGTKTWWGAVEEHLDEWPCGEESTWFIDPDNGNMVRGPQNDDNSLHQFRVQWWEMGDDYDTGLPLILVRVCRRAMRRRAAAISR